MNNKKIGIILTILLLFIIIIVGVMSFANKDSTYDYDELSIPIVEEDTSTCNTSINLMAVSIQEDEVSSHIKECTSLNEDYEYFEDNFAQITSVYDYNSGIEDRTFNSHYAYLDETATIDNTSTAIALFIVNQEPLLAFNFISESSIYSSSENKEIVGLVEPAYTVEEVESNLEYQLLGEITDIQTFQYNITVNELDENGVIVTNEYLWECSVVMTEYGYYYYGNHPVDDFDNAQVYTNTNNLISIYTDNGGN